MSAIEKSEEWEFHSSVVDGDRLELDGLNIWDHDWIDIHLHVNVKDPIYDEDHTMNIYEISVKNTTVRFAAGEFSNMVWGIYLPAIKIK